MAQRKAAVVLTTAAVLQVLLSRVYREPRLVWCLERSDNWWNYIVMRTFSPHDWLENFRVSWETYLCSQLRPRIARSDTRFHRAITVEGRVALTLWCLATPGEYRTIAHLFGVARCTVCIILHNVCRAIVDILLPQYICFPSGEDLQRTIDGFHEVWDVPQCAGAIDGSHIPICEGSLYLHLT